MKQTLPTQKAIRRNLKIDSLHIIRANNDRVLKSCPCLQSILIKAHGWDMPVVHRYRTKDYPLITMRLMYNQISK